MQRKKRNAKDILELHKKYEAGMSIRDVQKYFACDITHQSLYESFKRMNLPLRPPARRKPFKMYNDSKYTLDKDGYYRKTTGDREHLHRQIWKDHYGEIPKGKGVAFKEGHHTDFDSYKIDNLFLEDPNDTLRRVGKPFEKGKNYHGECAESFRRGKSRKTQTLVVG